MPHSRWILNGVGTVVVLVSAVSAQDPVTSQPQIWAARPDVSAFEKLENERLSRAQQAINAVMTVKGTRTIENSLVPYDEAILQLDNASNFARLMEAAHPDASFRDRASAMLSKVNAVVTSLSLNRDVYQALAKLDLSQADAETRYYMQRRLLMSRLAGVEKDEGSRARLQKLQEELTQAKSEFNRNISDDQTTVSADPSELDGLPQDLIDAHKPGLDGKVRISTNFLQALPVMTFAKSDSLRRRVWEGTANHAYPKNRDVLLKLLKIRFEIALMLGYSSWADYNAAAKMVMSGRRIAQFLDELNMQVRPVADREYSMLLAEKRKTDPSAKALRDYELFYLVDHVKRSQYSFDTTALRPYLGFAQVKQGMLDTAARFFHVSFRQELNEPSWDPTVEIWDVIDNGRIIGRIYLDMFAREGKDAGQTLPLADGVRGRQLPEVAILLNCTRPTATDPAFVDFDDVSNLFFHEFGHAMHRILSGQLRWAGTNTRNMESDFIEMPSQFVENWPLNMAILSSFAHKNDTGEPVPAELVSRMNKSATFGRGIVSVATIAAAAISYDLHKENPQNIDVDALCERDFQRYLHVEQLSGIHPYATFIHLADYSSDYYTYLWDQVIVEDFHEQFGPKDPFAADVASRYRRIVLEPGASMSANDLVKNFLGRPQQLTAFQHWVSEEFQPLPNN
jgi:thimet oligopeptidase